ncbi:MAG: DegT/DnrJ/EryC1/StrS family aminotransferase [Proteobacteria bacterium]|nr:DegT/DnrJ/EryC1/StrS family aminotransferase [Pseudomonadota bacterium]
MTRSSSIARAVPMRRVKAELSALRPAIDAAIARVLDSARLIGGPEVAAFEAELARIADVEMAVGVSSGTDALLVSLMAMDIGPGDEVVTTPFSFFATAGAIARVGARPVFADIDDDSLNLDPARALEACTARTRAILPVHLFGRPAVLPRADIPILEDAAQSLTAAPVRGQCATSSFFPAKNLGAVGDGGAVLTGDRLFAERIRILCNHGAKPKYFHHHIGGNFRLDALQAAVLRVKLPHLAGWIQARRSNARRYRTLFEQADVPAELRLPADVSEHTYNQFVIRVPQRDALRVHLADAGVATAVYYPLPLHLQPCFADLGYRPGALPVAERAAEDALALPIDPWLEPEEQDYVVDRIAAFYRR